MSWLAVAALCAAAYGLKLAGALAATRLTGERRGASLDALAVPVLAALVVVQTVGDGRAVVLDARLPALVLAVVLLRLGAPLLVVALAAGASAALLHHLGI